MKQIATQIPRRKKEAKTTAKGIGFSDDDLNRFADKLENDLKKKKLSERNVKIFCNSFYSTLNK